MTSCPVGIKGGDSGPSHLASTGCTASPPVVPPAQQLNKTMCIETNLVLSSVLETGRPVWPRMPPELLLSLHT